MAPSERSHPFDALDPGTMLDAVEAAGVAVDGRLLELNSYENRVFMLGRDDGDWVVAKFYRPGRWSDGAIREEHHFAAELAASEIPMVAPLVLHGETLHRHAGFRLALYPRFGGRAPEMDDPDVRERLGLYLARIHTIGAGRTFAERPVIRAEAARADRDWLISAGWVPDELVPAYRSVTDELLARLDEAFSRLPEMEMLRLHGDCHAGNVLWREGPHFVDLDDCMTAPAVQDLWMLLGGDREEMTVKLADVLEGYEAFRDFDRRELTLVEPLRTWRLLRYAAWLARRWDDPAFPRAFPWFGDSRYWEGHILALREQQAALDEPALQV